MNQISEKIIPMAPPFVPGLQSGKVVSSDDEIYCIQMAGKKINAKKAFSCLIDPEPGDTVLCSKIEAGPFYVLNVLERPVVNTIRVGFPKQSRVIISQKNIQICATENLTLSAEKMGNYSKTAVHRSHDMVVSCEAITATGNELHASFKTLRLISHLIHTMARQVLEQFKGYDRQTNGSDNVKTGQMTRQTKGLYALNSKYTILNSKESTMIDGEKILMG